MLSFSQKLELATTLATRDAWLAIFDDQSRELRETEESVADANTLARAESLQSSLTYTRGKLHELNHAVRMLMVGTQEMDATMDANVELYNMARRIAEF